MLTELQKKKLPNLFKFYDADGNGYIEAADFDTIHAAFCQAADWEKGSQPSEALKARLASRWANIQKHADANNDNRVSLDEWLAYVDKMLQSEEQYRAEVEGIVAQIFQVFDRDKDGQIDRAEYERWHRVRRLDAKSAAALFSAMDLNKDGFISVEETTQLVRQFFKSDNPADPGNQLFGAF
jgi:juvenile hormone diol kinase